MDKKTFTKEELKKYNGQNGQPAYVAVDGIVYDVSDVFLDGDHYSHIAGHDMTDDFYLQHAKEEIEDYPVVGKMID